MDLKNVDIFAYVDNFKVHEHIESIEIKKSEKDDYFLSIVIPTYKRPKELKEAIDSALNQEGDLFEYEVLVIDNNPERSDDTENLISTYSNPNLRYVKNSENIGMTGNWNRGFFIAKGKWLTMLHDDDMLYPYFLKVVKTYFDKSPTSFIPRHITGIEYKYCPQPSIIRYRQIYSRYYISSNFTGAPVGLTVRKDLFIKSGGFNASFYPSADYYWYLKFAKEFKLNQILEPIVFYRTAISESNNLNTQRQFIIKDFYLKRRLLSKIRILPYVISDYILGLDAIKREAQMREKYGHSCGFHLSDINLNSNYYNGVIKSKIALIGWKIWRLFLFVNLSTLKFTKKTIKT